LLVGHGGKTVWVMLVAPRGLFWGSDRGYFVTIALGRKHKSDGCITADHEVSRLDPAASFLAMVEQFAKSGELGRKVRIPQCSKGKFRFRTIGHDGGVGFGNIDRTDAEGLLG
jgi:hypothetical protein